MAWRPPPGYGVPVEGPNSHEQPAALSPEELKRLLESADGLVESLATQLVRQCADAIPREDLVGYGQQGLLEAALRFDSSRGVKFRTFAHYRVRGAMIDGLRKMGPWTRRGFEHIVLLRAANEASSDLAEEDIETLGARQSAERVRKHLASMVTAMTTGVFHSGHLAKGASEANSGADSGGAAQIVAVDESANAEEQLAKLELKQLVQTTLKELPPPEDQVLRRFYVEGDNMDRIAQDFGRSRSWVSRTHTRALSRMGARLRHEAQQE